MTDFAIRVENLSKRYRIGLQEARPETLVGAAAAWLKSPLHNFRRLRRLSAFSDAEAEDIIWALRDVSFEVKQGEVVGIIGRNGAGKSTLLKILSRITPPTAGRVVLNGRVASLLEVGTGFHPELTGRENIYLNGTILGMSKAEIARKFDEIVDFSGVEKFIDTPVKRYSSGMRVRLAFSVAAHLEPEMLLVDEVLAVGDIAFQKKCLGKMREVAGTGRTVLFVSHNMAAISGLCQTAIWLDEGRIKRQDYADTLVAEYINAEITSSKKTASFFPVINKEYGLVLEVFQANIKAEKDHACLTLEICLNAQQYIEKLGIGLWIHTQDGFLVARLPSTLTGNFIEKVRGRVVSTLKAHNVERFLASGEYTISLSISIPQLEKLIFMENACTFHVPPYDLFGSGKSYDLSRFGVVPLHLRIIDRHEIPLGFDADGIF